MDIDVFAPYTIHEAEFALYLADRSGNVASNAPVFLGGKLEELEPELDFQKNRVDRHGEPFGRIYHSDEEHRFNIKNLWLMDRATKAMPRVRRNQSYVMVIRWNDKETNTWAIRTYYGVTADGQRLLVQDEVFHQNVPFTARYMDERSGLENVPTLSPVLTGLVVYVTASEFTPLYVFDFGSGEYTEIDAALLPLRAEIESDSDHWAIKFQNVSALLADEDGVHVNELTAIGGTFPIGAAPYPRIEFWVGPTRVGSVSATGELAVADLTEVDDEPSLPDPDFRAKTGTDWRLSIARTGAYALEFLEDLT